MSSETVILWCQ